MSLGHLTTFTATDMDTLDLSPGKSIGLFALGDTLWHVLDILRARKSEVPKLEIAWDPEVRYDQSLTPS